MPFMLRVVLIYLGIYVVGLALSFVSEITYKKRAISDVRGDWKRIVRQASIIFCVFVVGSIVWGVLGIESQ